MEPIGHTPLLERLSGQMGCQYLSDLHFLTREGRALLAARVRRIPPEAASRREWEDALRYLTAQPPRGGAGELRRQLLSALETPPPPAPPAGRL